MIKNRAGVEADVHGWNWGAFAFSWIWGVGNKTYWPLIILVPFFNIIWIFVCGAMGNKWAWQSSQHKDFETFQAVQKTWNLAGLIQIIIGIVLFLITIASWTSIAALLYNSMQ